MWCGSGRSTRPGLKAQNPVALERAPEICVEVLSPSNSKPEMEEKRALYFEAGGKVGGFLHIPAKRVNPGFQGDSKTTLYHF